MIDNALSDAICIYIGKGRTKAPSPDKSRLAFEIGHNTAAELLPRIEALVSEMDSIEVDWNRMNLNQATDHVMAIMRERHTHISEDALMALDWLFSFSWR